MAAESILVRQGVALGLSLSVVRLMNRRQSVDTIVHNSLSPHTHAATPPALTAVDALRFTRAPLSADVLRGFASTSQ